MVGNRCDNAFDQAHRAHVVMLAGGSACGKSTFGEALCMRSDCPRTYIATMKPYGAEELAKIEKHRAQRADKGFTTVEMSRDLAAVVLPSAVREGTALLEDVGNLIANELFVDDREVPVEKALENLDRGLCALESQCGNLVAVTNEIGADAGDYGEGTRAYQQLMGAVACRLASRFDTVVECVFGVPIMLKGKLEGSEVA